MSRASATFAIALVLSLAVPVAAFAYMAGEAGSGNLPISGIPLGPANVGGVNNVLADPSGIGNASKIPSLPPPQITVPVIPTFK